jgi:hypothetical protein
MKRILLCASLALSFAFAGCGALPQAPHQTPAQIAAVVCPGAKTALNTVILSGVFTGGALDTLDKQVQPDLDAVCVAGAAVTTADLDNLANVAFPLVLSIVNASGLSADDKKYAALGVTVAQGAIQTALALQAAPVTASTVPQ